MSENTNKIVMPIIYVDSVDDVRAFYVDKLGFGQMMGVLGKDGKLDFVTVTRSGAKLMFARPEESIDGAGAVYPTKRPVSIYFEVDDIDAYYAELQQREVKSLTPPENQWWGDRIFTVDDTYGYSLMFFQTVGEPIPPKGMKIV